MYIVKFHFIDKDNLCTRTIILSRGCYISSTFPKNLVFVTIEDSNMGNCFLFLIKGKVNIIEHEIVENRKHIILCGNRSVTKFTWHFNCNKAVMVYMPSMYLMSRIIRIIGQNRFEDMQQLSNKIKDYCEEKKVACYV